MTRDIRKEDADLMCTDCFTEDEIDAVRKGLKQGVKDATAEQRRRRTPIHSRIQKTTRPPK